MADITKIVITGGPSGGKSTLIKEVSKTLSEYGYRTVIVSETATELILSGISPKNCPDFQLVRMKLQKEREAAYEMALSSNEGRALLICDRGMMDSRAYMDGERFKELLSKIGMTEDRARDGYDGVFHLCTAAKGFEESYTLSNNPARTESAAEAALLDDKVIAAWAGSRYFKVIGAKKDINEKKEELLFEIKAFLGVSEKN